jgi:hypothetical protein
MRHPSGCCLGQEGISRGLKPAFVVGLNVQAKAWTYLRSRDKSKSNGKATTRAKCGGLSTTAAKCAAFGRDDGFVGREEQATAKAKPEAFFVEKVRSGLASLGASGFFDSAALRSE